MLEVDSLAPASQVRTSQISGTTEQFRNLVSKGSQDTFGQLTGGNSLISRSETRESSFPTFRQLTIKTTLEFSTFSGELLLVLFEQGVPFGFGGSTGGGTGTIEFVNLK